MRRFALRTGRPALMAAMGMIALVAFLPMRLALGWLDLPAQGLTAARVSGSVWGGTLTGARFGDLALGDLSAGVSPLPLLIGRARVILSGPNPGAGDARPLSGAVTLGRHLLGVDGLSASLATGNVFAPLPVSALDLTAVTIRFRDGACEAAEGRVGVSLSGDLGGVALPPMLTGAVRCDGRALLIPLASQAGTEQLSLRVTPDGRYHAQLSVRPTEPLAGAKLEAAGFVAGPDGYGLAAEGAF